MKNSSDLRKGIRSLGKSRRVPISINKQADSPVQAIEQNKTAEGHFLDSNTRLGEILQAINGLGKIIQETGIQSPTNSTNLTSNFNPSVSIDYSPEIIMDDSIIDVGTGIREDMKRGEGSSSIAKQSDKQDKKLASSKSKLKSLKRKKG